MRSSLRSFALWAIVILLLLALFALFQNPGRRTGTNAPHIPFTRLLSEAEEGRVRSVLIIGRDIEGTFTDGHTFETYAPSDTSWIQRLYGRNVSITVRPEENDVPWYVQLVVSWLPFLVLVSVWVSLTRHQTRSWSEAIKRPFEEIHDLRRQMDEMQKRLDTLSEKDRP